MHHQTSFKRTTIALLLAQTITISDVSAATITVNNGADNTQECSFREAIETINAGAAQPNGCIVNSGNGSLGSNDSIQFDLPLSVVSLSSEVQILNDVALNPGGSLVTISGSSSSRLLEIRDTTVSIENMTLRGGSNSNQGGGIYTFASELTLENVTISGNSAPLGGGIHAYYGSSVTISNSTISGNTSNLAGGGVRSALSRVTLTNSTISGNSSAGSGGAIYSGPESSLYLTNTTLSANSADIGGGISSFSGISISLTDCSISENWAGSSGGGISSIGTMATLNNCSISGNSAGFMPDGTLLGGGGVSIRGGSMNINNSRISGNHADFAGAGLYASSYNAVTFSNSTISGNSVNGVGGGVNATTKSTVTLLNSTVSGNSVGTNGGGFNLSSSVLDVVQSTISGNMARYAGGGINSYSGSDESYVSLSNSILAGNASQTGQEIVSIDSEFTFNSCLLGEISKTSAQAFSGPSVVNFDINLVATSDGNRPTPLAGILAPLANNGGASQTHALPLGSPAIDASSNVGCPARDQRGVVRPQGRACDIGAFEFNDTSSFFVVPLPDGNSVIFGL